MSSPLLAAHHSCGLHVVSDGALAARLTSRSRAALQAYREITRAGEPAGLTLYHVDRWLGLFHPYRTSMWVRLQSLARVRGAVQPSLVDLAATLRGLSEEKVRHYLVQFWEDEQPGNLEWEFFRAALTIERRAGKSYRFLNVVLDDLLHPDDLPELDQLTARFQASGEGELRLPTPVYPREKPAGPELRPVTKALPSENPAGTPPPTPPMSPALPGALPGILAEGEGGVYPEAADVPRLLAELGVQPAGIRRLLRHPSGMATHWGARWAVWVSAKQGLAQPGGFLFSRILGACEGDPECQEPPLAWVVRQERAQTVHRRRERTAAVVASRPDPFLARKTSPRPDPATAVLPELAEVWALLRAEPALPVRAALAAATAVTLDGDVLVIELPGISAEALRSRREQLLQVARTLCPGLSDLRFLHTRSGH
jgi:hypothetical protein